MTDTIAIIGGGLAGSEAALQLAFRGFMVDLYERRPSDTEPVHSTGLLAELVCSNSFKSMKPDSASGMLKAELAALGSFLYQAALDNRVDAGGALAVNRNDFAQLVTCTIEVDKHIQRIHGDVEALHTDGSLTYATCDDMRIISDTYDAIIIATGPLTSDTFATWLEQITDSQHLAFFDAAAPIVMADSINTKRVFRQSRYEDEGQGDYLNAAFTREEYDAFIDALIHADRVIARDFETSDLFQACQPIEEIARKGHDALRYGTMKPVGLTDPSTGKRPWAVLQLRAEDTWGQSYNLVGCQTNLTFSEQQRIFRMVPGLEQAEFARYGVMHRNTFVNAPALLDCHQRLTVNPCDATPVYLAGQISGTEGYGEAIRSGLHAALSCAAYLKGINLPLLPIETAYGSLLAYATNPNTTNYQPKHVNFGDQPPLSPPVRNKRQRYAAYARRALQALESYRENLCVAGLDIPSLRGAHE